MIAWTNVFFVCLLCLLVPCCWNYVCSCSDVSRSQAGRCESRVLILFIYFWASVIYIVCVLQLVITVALNVVSAALAITAAVLYSIDLAMGSSLSCYREHYYYSSNNDWPAHKKSNFESCFYYKNLSQVMIWFIFFSVIKNICV